MKLLLYCTKQPHKLYATDKGYVITDFELGDYYKTKEKLNGKIVAECDFEVESINVLDCTFRTFNLTEKEILNKSCLTYKELFEYLKNRCNPRGYAIHIKNLHIFDKPRDITKLVLINQYRNDLEGTQYNRVKVAPQNMCIVDYAIDCNYKENIFDSPYILISIRPEWLCKILNKEKTIEIRKKVLKEMLK